MLSIIAGAGGAMWFTVCMPQAIFSIFFKNHLGATASQLGLLVSLFQLAGVMNLAAPFIF